MNISLVLPAYNEGKNIKDTLEFLVQNKNMSEIIVVNDGSTDNTAEICASFSQITCINLTENKGKTNAVLTGVQQAKHDHILLFDADLTGLKQEYIERLINKYKSGFDMVIMDYGNMDWIRSRIFQAIAPLSGVRILHKNHFEKLSLTGDNPFELETRINEYFLKNRLSITIVEAKTVQTPFKFEKYPFFVGLWSELKAIKQYLFLNGILGVPAIFKQWRYINKLRS